MVGMQVIGTRDGVAQQAILLAGSLCIVDYRLIKVASITDVQRWPASRWLEEANSKSFDLINQSVSGGASVSML